MTDLFSVALDLTIKLIPIFIIILLGYIAGITLKPNAKSIADILIYIVAPIVVSGYIATMSFRASYIFLPITIFIFACTISFIALWIGHHLHDCPSTKSLQAAASGDGNSGYYGVPLFMALFPHDDLGLYIWIYMGGVIFSYTLSYYYVVRTQFNIRDSFIKLFKLPVVYAAITGFTLSALHFNPPAIYITTLESFRGAFVILGMMTLGLALSQIKHLSIDWKFVSAALGIRFLLWPFMIISLILVDQATLHCLTTSAKHALLTLSIVPMAVNTVVYATQFDAKPDKIATTVLLSTIFSLLYTPVYFGAIHYFGLISMS
jgi:predicted permease